MARSQGAVKATHLTVSRYLVDNFRLPGGETLRYTDADRLIANNLANFDRAVNFGSHAYFVGDEIAEAEKLEYISEEEKPFPKDDDE